MKHFGCIFMSIILICGCGTMNKQKINCISASAGVSVSPRLMALCDILNECIKEKGDAGLCTPDEQTIRSYALKSVNGEYWVSGVLTVTPDFQADNDLTAKGIVLTALTPEVFSYSVPIRELNALLHLPGIVKADCARPVQLKSF